MKKISVFRVRGVIHKKRGKKGFRRTGRVDGGQINGGSYFLYG